MNDKKEIIERFQNDDSVNSIIRGFLYHLIERGVKFSKRPEEIMDEVIPAVKEMVVMMIDMGYCSPKFFGKDGKGKKRERKEK